MSAWLQYLLIHNLVLDGDAIRGRIAGERFYFDLGSTEREVSARVFIGSLLSSLYLVLVHTGTLLALPRRPERGVERVLLLLFLGVGAVATASILVRLGAAIRAVS